MNKRQWASSLGGVILGLSVLTSCGYQAVPTNPLRVGGMQAVMTHLDPHHEWDGWFLMRYGVGETLFKLDDALAIEPWLALSYEEVDPLTWRIHLRPDVHFSNGKVMTPEAVIASLERSAQVNKRAKSLQGASYEVEDTAILIHTAKEEPTLINDLTDPYTTIIDVTEPVGPDQAPVATGAYTITDYALYDHVTMDANPYYWAGPVGAQHLEFIQVRDMNTLEMALQTGEIDIAQGLSAQAASIVEHNPSVKVLTTAQPRAYMLYFNMDKMTDLNVRKALLVSANRQAIGQGALKGALTPASGPFLESTIYGDKRDLGTFYRPEEVAPLLKASGYHKNDTSGLWEKAGQPLTIHLGIYKRYASLPLAVELQNQWRQQGITVIIDQHENESFFTNHDFEVGIYTMITMPTGSPYAYLRDAMGTQGNANFGNYSNEHVDQTLALLQADPTGKESVAYVQDILAQGEADAAYAFFGFNNLTMGLNSRLEGYHAWPIDYYQMSYKVRRNDDE